MQTDAAVATAIEAAAHEVETERSQPAVSAGARAHQSLHALACARVRAAPLPPAVICSRKTRTSRPPAAAKCAGAAHAAAQIGEHGVEEARGGRSWAFEETDLPRVLRAVACAHVLPCCRRGPRRRGAHARALPRPPRAAAAARGTGAVCWTGLKSAPLCSYISHRIARSYVSPAARSGRRVRSHRRECRGVALYLHARASSRSARRGDDTVGK